MNVKAEAYQEYNQAAVVDKLITGLPEVVKRLADDIQWTTDLGNAFLAQQSDVMDAVQRMRKKAQDKGNLKTTEQQKVETKVVENKTVVVVEQANPQVVSVEWAVNKQWSVVAQREENGLLGLDFFFKKRFR